MDYWARGCPIFFVSGVLINSDSADPQSLLRPETLIAFLGALIILAQG
jgi:hypothetical protein